MAMQTMELEPDAFWRMVTQENLKVGGPSAGYQWAGKQGKNGWETYKVKAQPKGWLYQARRVTTNVNAAGGAIVVDITLATGQVATVTALYATQTTLGTHTLFVQILDEDNAVQSRLAGLAAGASTNLSLPSIGSVASSSSNLAQGPIVLGPGQKLSIFESDASAQANDTLTVGLTLLMSTPDLPTWDKSRSANAANTTIAASTISSNNELQAVYL